MTRHDTSCVCEYCGVLKWVEVTSYLCGGGRVERVTRLITWREPRSTTSPYITAKQPEPCWHCGKPTRFVEINFEAHLHPGDCTDAKDVEYFAALKAGADDVLRGGYA